MHKILLALSIVLAACSGSWAAAPAAGAAPDMVRGKVLDTVDAGTYTYVHLRAATGDVWAAVYKAPLKVGTEVLIDHAVLMKDFHSKVLNRTFPEVYFGMLESGAAGAALPAAVSPHAATAKAAADGVDAHVAKPAGANAYTIAAVIAQAQKLAGKTVVIRGKVVKYNPEIMGKNWVHLRDGSGMAGGKPDEILVTTTDATKLGDIVTARGSVRTQVDFGAGYAYPVMLESATLKH